jgi:hypothetical protein
VDARILSTSRLSLLFLVLRLPLVIYASRQVALIGEKCRRVIFALTRVEAHRVFRKINYCRQYLPTIIYQWQCQHCFRHPYAVLFKRGSASRAPISILLFAQLLNSGIFSNFRKSYFIAIIEITMLTRPSSLLRLCFAIFII